MNNAASWSFHPWPMVFFQPVVARFFLFCCVPLFCPFTVRNSHFHTTTLEVQTHSSSLFTRGLFPNPRKINEFFRGGPRGIDCKPTFACGPPGFCSLGPARLVRLVARSRVSDNYSSIKDGGNGNTMLHVKRLI